MAGSFYLLVVDQAPWIDAALLECRKAFAEVEALRQRIARFESEDRPAYERWYHSTFGARITQLRDLAALVFERESALAALRQRHWEHFFSDAGEIDETHARAGRPITSAAGRSAWGSSSGGEGDDDEASDEDSFDGFSYRDEAGEAEDGFEDGFEDEFGEGGPDSVREFEEALRHGSDRRYGQGAYRSRGAATEDDRERADRRREKKEKWQWYSRDEARERAGRERARNEILDASLRERLKKRYRHLVRKLHPDLNPDLGSEQRALWHRVQSAYERGDLEQLDLLNALSDVFSGELSRAIGLGSLRDAAREIEKLQLPLRTRLKQIEAERAWAFAAEGEARAELFAEIDLQFRRELRVLDERYAQLELQIARFARRAPAPERSPGGAAASFAASRARPSSPRRDR